MPSKHLSVFDLSGPAPRVANRWRKWKRAFEYYAEGQSLTDPKKKTAQLLHFAGMDLQDLFEDLPDHNPPSSGDDAYKKAIRKLDYRFKFEENFPYERHVFRQTRLTDGETADQFVTRLRKQARHCNFGATLDDNLRDQLIEQVKDLELKKKLLETKNITLEQALEKARAWETANIQAKDMARGESKPPTVNYVKQPDERRKLICHSCGREGHIKRDRMCPARGRKCAKCHVSGHFAACRAEGNGKNKDDTSNNKSFRGQQKQYSRQMSQQYQ